MRGVGRVRGVGGCEGGEGVPEFNVALRPQRPYGLLRDTGSPTLQGLVHDTLPSTTAVFSYAIRSRKLSANEQFLVGAQTVVSCYEQLK